MPVPAADPAARIEAAFAARIGTSRFQLWFPPNARFVWLGHEFVLAARTLQFQDYATDKFGEALQQAVTEVLGAGTPVRFVTDAELFAGPAERKVADAPKTVQTLFGEAPVEIPRPKKEHLKPTRRWKTFADFVVGPCNRVAHAAALAAAEEPGMAANPVVLFGPCGVGKTHLLEAAYAMMRKVGGDTPQYIHAEEFANRFGQAIRFGKMSAFRRQFRDCSALLFDDLNFLESKTANQEEFLHTLDALTSDGRQVIVTTDCHPRLAEKLLPELADRLLGGAVWSLMPPDDATRVGILRRKAMQAQPMLSDDVLKFLAKNLNGNVRELEGAVNSVRHYAKVTGSPATPTLAREALGDLLRHTVRTVTVADVEAAVCSVLKLAAGTLRSKSRSWAVSHPRMIAMYLARKHTSATYGEIAKHFGVKQHSTAVAGEKKVRAWLAAKETLALGDRKWAAKDLLERVERELAR